jgi:hypothetical protein
MKQYEHCDKAVSSVYSDFCIPVITEMNLTSHVKNTADCGKYRLSDL